MGHIYSNVVRAFNGVADQPIWTIPPLIWQGTTYTYANSATYPHFLDWSYDANACYVLVQYDGAWDSLAPFAVWRFQWDGSDMSLHGQPFVWDKTGWTNVDDSWPSSILVAGGYVFVGGSRYAIPTGGNPNIVALPVGDQQGNVWEEVFVDTLTYGWVEGMAGTYDSTTWYAGEYRDASASYLLRATTRYNWTQVLTSSPGTITWKPIWARDNEALVERKDGNTHWYYYTSTGGDPGAWSWIAERDEDITSYGGIEYDGNVLFQIQENAYTPSLMSMGALLRANGQYANVVFIKTNDPKSMHWGGPWTGLVDGTAIPPEPPYPGTPPGITMLDPPVIYALGEDVVVTISGYDFDANATVTFEGVPARNVVITEFSITCLPPATGFSCAPDALDRTITVVVSNNNRSSDASSTITWKPRLWVVPIQACDISGWQVNATGVTNALNNPNQEWIVNAFKTSGNLHMYSSTSYCWLNWDSPNGWTARHTHYPYASLPAGITIYALNGVGPTLYCYTNPVDIQRTVLGTTRNDDLANGFWTTLNPADRTPGNFQWTNTPNGYYFVQYQADYSDLDISGETIQSIATSGFTLSCSTTMSPYGNALAFWWSDPIQISGETENVEMSGHWEAPNTPQPADLTP